MKKEKYYYSEPLYNAKMNGIVVNRAELCYTSSLEMNGKKVPG